MVTIDRGINIFPCDAPSITMIEHTFQIMPSVGAKKEMNIWEEGILSWDDFLSADSIGCVKPALKEKRDAVLMQASELLDDGESRLLGDMVPKGEHWRMFDHFRDDAAYLDKIGRAHV